MKINVEELEWVLIKRCENFSKVEIGKDKAPMYWFDAEEAKYKQENKEWWAAVRACFKCYFTYPWGHI